MHDPENQRQAARMFEARAYRAGLNPDSAAYAGKERALPLVLALERLKAAGEDSFAQAQEAALAEVYNYETIDLEEAFRVRDLIRKAMPNENARPSRNPETGLQEFSGSRGYIPGEAIKEPEEIVVTGTRGGGIDLSGFDLTGIGNATGTGAGGFDGIQIADAGDAFRMRACAGLEEPHLSNCLNNLDTESLEDVDPNKLTDQEILERIRILRGLLTMEDQVDWLKRLPGPLGRVIPNPVRDPRVQSEYDYLVGLCNSRSSCSMP